MPDSLVPEEGETETDLEDDDDLMDFEPSLSDEDEEL